MSLEFRAVRDPMLKYLQQLGWNYLEPGECLDLREDASEPFILPVLRRKLKELNLGVIMTDEQADEIIKRLKSIRASIRGNQEFLEYLRGEKTVYIDEEKRELNVRLIDFDNVENNEFNVTKEFRFEDRKPDRIDIVLAINGVPVIVIEAKAPSVKDAASEALGQARRYHDEMPELMKFVQLYALSNGMRLMFGPTWDLTRRNMHRWKLTEKVDLENLTKDFFQMKRVLELIEDYTVFFTKDEELYKLVLDQHQMRGVEKIVKRTVEGKLDSGLIWHTTGSGKTLTMIVAAHRLRRQSALENPTMLTVVDRTELEAQMWGNLVSFGFPNCTIARSKEHLQDLLRTDFRGLIVTTIQKFEGMSKDINLRKNIVILVDEAHRSQEGNLAIYMRGALPKARYFGFTGTPIDKSSIGKGTFTVFGKHDAQGYLDRYSTKESIADGTTVPLYYTLAPLNLRVNRELLEKEFFELVEKEGIASIEELDKLLDRAVNLKNFLKAGDRVDKIAEYIADHFKQFVEPLGLKAFIVAVDREGCALYKRAIDKYLPAEYSRVVFTEDQRDGNLLRQFYMSEEEESNVRKSFRSAEKLPKILIVTQKLLTGFDAPVLYCMYLDKPLKDHTLLQAIARVNRPLGDEEGEKKTAGLIVDFVGVLDNLKRALSFDSEVVEGALTDLSILKKRFAELMGEAQQYLTIAEGGTNDKTLTVLSEKFTDSKEREKFFRLFKGIEEIYEILSPDVFLRDYLEAYRSLAQLCKIVQNMFRPDEVDVYRDLMSKTKRLIREHVNIEEIIASLPVYKIDDEVIERIEADKKPEKAKVVNLYRSIILHIRSKVSREPYLYSVGERAEEIIRKFEEKQIASEEALKELMNIAQEIGRSEIEKNQLKLTWEEFNIYWALKENEVTDDKAGLARDMFRLLDSNKTWLRNRQKEMEVRRNLYKILLKKVESDRLSTVVNSVLEIHRRMVEQ